MNYVKRYFWPIHFALVTLVAFLAAGAANKVLAAKLFDKPAASVIAPPPRVASSGGPKSRPLTYYAGIAKRNVFNSKATPEDAEAAAAAASSAAAAKRSEEKEYGELEDTTLNLDLKGTAVSTVPEESYAIIEDPKSSNKDKQRLYRMNDSIQEGVTLVKVEKLRVVLDNRGKLEELDLRKGDQTLARTPPGPAFGQPPPPPFGADDVGSGVRQTGANSYEVPEGEIDKALSNLNSLLTQARVVPNFENGVTNGFKVFAIRPNSIFERLGVKNGDVISKINNIEINSPDKAFALLTQLRNERTLTMEVLRGGNVESFTYNIQ